MTRKATNAGFKVGDRVKVKPHYPVAAIAGRVGYIIAIERESFGVDLGNNTGIDLLHDLDRNLPTRTGWYISDRYLEITKESYLHEYFKGR